MRLDLIAASLVGSVRVRRHPHRHARSAPQCGVSHGPRAYRVRVPINSSSRFGCSGEGIDLRYPLELSEIFLPMMGQPANDRGVAKQLCEISAGKGQMQIVD